MTRRQVDHAALAARFQERAEAALYDTSDGPCTLSKPANTSLVLPPAPPATMHQLPTADSTQVIDVRSAGVVQTEVHTSQRDHSVGFLLRVTPLAAAFAITAGVLTVAVFETPVLSVKTLAIVFLVFSAVFLYAFRKDLDASPAGIALRHTIGLWRHIDEERRFRHKWYLDERDYTRKANRR